MKKLFVSAHRWNYSTVLLFVFLGGCVSVPCHSMMRRFVRPLARNVARCTKSFSKTVWKEEEVCNKEIEVKIQIDEELLQQTKLWLDGNAEFQGSICQKDYYLDNPEATFIFTAPEGYKDASDYLRVRFAQDGDSLCFKTLHLDPVENTPSYNDEYEVGVVDGEEALKFLAALGYTDQTIVEKERITYVFDNFEIVIDRVKNVGVFIEVELKDYIDCPQDGIDKIYDVLRTIGIEKFELQTRGYISMLWNPEFGFEKTIEV